jgi:predicted DNA-binding transcriptional regulator YafY
MKKGVHGIKTTAHPESRRLDIRKILTRCGGMMSTEEICNVLAAKWSTLVNVRTTRRDLENLEEIGYVVRHASELRDDHRSWYWSIRTQSLEVTFTVEESMTFAAALQHAERSGFRLDTDEIGILRDHAAGVLHRHSVGGLTVDDRIVVGSRLDVLQPAQYSAEHLTTIQAAMVEERSLEIRYRPRGVHEIQCSYTLCPLGLAYQDNNIYLVAFVGSEKWHGTEPASSKSRSRYSSNGPGAMCALMLHRIVSVGPTDNFAPKPANFNIRSPEIRKELIMLHNTEEIELKLSLSIDLFELFGENELGTNQKIERSESGWSLTCKTQDTEGLRSLLLGYASGAEVLAPEYLRDHICQQLEAALARYGR